jgi:hypothetical protein
VKPVLNTKKILEDITSIDDDLASGINLIKDDELGDLEAQNT